MRVRYCKILQSVRVNKEEDTWLTPLDSIHALGNDFNEYSSNRLLTYRKHSLSRFQKVQKYFVKIWYVLYPPTEPSSDWLFLESQQPVKITAKMKSCFRRYSAKNNHSDQDGLILQQWLDTLITWMNDNEEAVAVIDSKDFYG